MSRLSDWLSYCSDLWKARKQADLHALAREMDAALGPWSEGNRADAIEHVESIGRLNALKIKNPVPGSPEHKANRFMLDTKLYARSQRKSSLPMLTHKDTLTGPIDKEHLQHYADRWASHNEQLEHVPRGQAKETDEGVTHGLVGKGGRAVQQFRSNLVLKRMKTMRQQGHQEPFATPHDLDVIHTGVERAIQLGHVSTESANRYHVMRSALQKNQARHAGSHPGLPFAPSYAAMDTEALKTMRAGVEHLHETGFGSAKEQLSSVLTSAIASHEAHPFFTESTKDRTAFAYPHLHPIGSPEHQKQEIAIGERNARIDARRSRSEAAPEPKAAPAVKAPAVETAAASNEPKTFEEYTTRKNAGETFSPAVHLQMAKLKRQKTAVEKAFAAAGLLNALKGWRNE